MKFLEYLLKHQISLWKDFYLNYKLLKKILKPVHALYKKKLKYIYLGKINKDNLREPLTGDAVLDDADVDVSQVSHQFKNQIILELKKVEHFYSETLHKRIEPRLKEITEKLEKAKLDNIFNNYEKSFEIAIKEIYKEISILKDFADLNLKAKVKIMKKYNKVMKILDHKKNPEFAISTYVDEFLESSEVYNSENTFNALFNQCNKVFSSGYADKYKEETNKILRKYAKKKNFDQAGLFYLGLAVGAIIFQVIVIFCMSFSYQINIKSDTEFRLLSPIFYSFAIIAFTLLLLGVNQIIWRKKNISYKILFSIPSIENNTFASIQQCISLLLMFFTVWVLYLINRTGVPFLQPVLNFFPSDSYPFIIWGFFLIYLAFPFHNFFFYEARIYGFRLFQETFTFHVEFRHIWLVEMLISLAGPIRGIEYLCCYLIYVPHGSVTIERYCSFNYPTMKFFAISIVPILMRVTQCIIILVKKQKAVRNLYSRLGNVLNIIKNLMIILISFVSYLASTDPSNYYAKIWFKLAIVTTIACFLYDAKYEFDLLQCQGNFPLRKTLYYSEKSYYFSLVIDLCLRFVFLLSMSPEIVKIYQGDYTINALVIIYIGETLRRFIWNILRIESKHIQVSRRYQMATDVHLPSFKDKAKGRTKTINSECSEILQLITENESKSLGGEIIRFESKNIGDIEDLSRYDLETFYEKELVLYLKNYYSKTVNNIGEENIIIKQTYIINNELLEN